MMRRKREEGEGIGYELEDESVLSPKLLVRVDADDSWENVRRGKIEERVSSMRWEIEVEERTNRDHSSLKERTRRVSFGNRSRRSENQLRRDKPSRLESR